MIRMGLCAFLGEGHISKAPFSSFHAGIHSINIMTVDVDFDHLLNVVVLYYKVSPSSPFPSENPLYGDHR